MTSGVGDEDGWVLFSGAPREGDIAHQAAQRGMNLQRIDLLNAGVHDDVTDDRVMEGIATRMRARARRPGKGFLAVAIPCRSFSPARRHRVRVKGLPWGPAQGSDTKQRRFLDRENDIVRRALSLMRLALSLGFEVVFEHPAKTNDSSRPRFFNRRAKRCASIFDIDMLRQLVAEFGMFFVEFPQCALLGLTMKPTRLLYTHRLHVILGPLDRLDCEHRPGGHPGGQAYGRDKRGRSLSAQTAAYPFAMAAVIVDCAELALGCPLHQLRLRPRLVVTAPYLSCCLDLLLLLQPMLLLPSLLQAPPSSSVPATSLVLASCVLSRLQEEEEEPEVDEAPPPPSTGVTVGTTLHTAQPPNR